MKIEYEIIDFHTHPFMNRRTNICDHPDSSEMTPETTRALMEDLGVSKICGSVFEMHKDPTAVEDVWADIKASNDEALALRDLYNGFYVPGFHIHPDYIRESCEEIERMSRLGVKMVGELVPYNFCWKDYSCKAFSELLDVCQQYGMVVNFHSMGEDEMDKMVKDHPKVTFVAAHPGEYPEFMRHMERMKTSENYYLDLSGYGIFRHGMLRHAIDLFGPERFLFGSDYPTCSPGMYIGGVYFDTLITHREKELIFAENTKRILGL